MFVTAKVLYYGILLSAYCCFFQHKSANADTISTKVALRLDARPDVVFFAAVVVPLLVDFGVVAFVVTAAAVVVAAAVVLVALT